MDKKFIKDSMWVGSSKVVTKLVGVIFFILVIKILSKEDYGLVRYVLSLASILVVIISSGYSTTLVRHLGLHSKNKKVSEELFVNTIIIIAVLFVVFMLGTLAFGKFSLALLVITFGLCYFDLYSAVIAGSMNIKKIGLFNMMSSVLKILFILPFILFGQYTSAILVAFAYAVSFLLSGFILERFYPTDFKFNFSLFSFKVLGNISKFASNIILSGAASAVIGSLDLIIIERVMDLTSVATYGLAKTFASAFILIPQSLSIILLPKISSFIKDTKRINRYFFFSIGLVLFGSVGVLGVYYFFGKKLILVLSTPEYLSSYPILILLSVGTIFSALYWIVSTFIIAMGKPGVNTVIMVGIGLLYLAINSILISKYGLMGVAWAFTISYAVGFFVILIYYMYYIRHLDKKIGILLEVQEN